MGPTATIPPRFGRRSTTCYPDHPSPLARAPSTPSRSTELGVLREGVEQPVNLCISAAWHGVGVPDDIPFSGFGIEGRRSFPATHQQRSQGAPASSIQSHGISAPAESHR
jgi:hypothetical protein